MYKNLCFSIVSFYYFSIKNIPEGRGCSFLSVTKTKLSVGEIILIEPSTEPAASTSSLSDKLKHLTSEVNLIV